MKPSFYWIYKSFSTNAFNAAHYHDEASAFSGDNKGGGNFERPDL